MTEGQSASNVPAFEEIGKITNLIGWIIGALILVAAASYLFWPRTPELFRLRVTVVNPERTPVNDAKVYSSIGGEPKKVEGGWQFDIPAANSPKDGKLKVFAEDDFHLLMGEMDVQLDSEPNPSVVIQMIKRNARIGGIVVDGENHAVAGATVTAVDVSNMANPSAKDGKFEVFVIPNTKGDPVRLRAEKEGFESDEEIFRQGQNDAKLVLRKKRGK